MRLRLLALFFSLFQLMEDFLGHGGELVEAACFEESRYPLLFLNSAIGPLEHRQVIISFLGFILCIRAVMKDLLDH